MAKRVELEKRVTLRLARPLLAEIEAAAAEDSRPVGTMIRKVLADWAAERVIGRARAAAA